MKKAKPKNQAIDKPKRKLTAWCLGNKCPRYQMLQQSCSKEACFFQQKLEKICISNS